MVEVESTENDGERFAQLRKAIPVVLAFQRGDRLSLAQIQQISGYGYQQAKRLRATLSDQLGLEEGKVGRDSIWFLPGATTLGSPDMLDLLALEFADAGMKSFLECQVHARWRALAARAIESAPPHVRDIHESLDRAVVFLRGPHVDASLVEDALEVILDCLANRNRLSTTYGGTNRTLEPWSILICDGALYLYAYEPTASKAKTMRLEKLSECRRVRGATYEYPSRYRHNPAELFRHSIGVWLNEESAPEHVRLRVSGAMQDYVRATSVHPTERKWDGADCVEVSMNVLLTPELERWIMGLGEECEVVEPQHLRERIARRHAEAAARYGATVGRAAR